MPGEPLPAAEVEGVGIAKLPQGPVAFGGVGDVFDQVVGGIDESEFLTVVAQGSGPAGDDVGDGRVSGGKGGGMGGDDEVTSGGDAGLGRKT
jgi:hypothetical protein